MTLTKAFVNDGVRMAKSPAPTKAELEILQVLWRDGPQSVRDVQRVLARTREVGYTSVLKTIQIMTDKGLVDRDDSVRPQIYRAKYSQDRTQKQMLADLLQRAYGGSIKALVLHAIGNRKVAAADLAALERLLDRFDGEQK